MEQYSQWFVSNYGDYWKKIGELLKNFFIGIYNIFIGNMVEFIKSLTAVKSSFSSGEMVMAVFSIILVLVLHLAVIFLIGYLIFRYARFVKREYSKEKAAKVIAKLKLKITQLQDEKNALLALSREQLPSEKKRKKAQELINNRFPKLTKIDEKYNCQILETPMQGNEVTSLNELVGRFVNYAASQLHLYYNKKTIAIFFAGLATSKTMIIEGISGTGKTSLPYAMGKFFNHDAEIISVQPSWRDRSEMIGYLNEFTKKYNETEFLRAVYEANYRTDLTFLVLDEVNLARIEYYFADFLSILEMPDPDEWVVEIIADQKETDPHQFENGKMRIPQNIWFIGTANRDDSTFTITDKVYDRASSIEINDKAVRFDAPYTESIHMSYEYLNKMFENAYHNYSISQKMLDDIAVLDKYIVDNFQISFGNRIMKQIQSFIPIYLACGGTEVDAMDYLLARKVIRKFETLNLPFMQKEIEDLKLLIEKLFGKNTFKESISLLDSFIKQI